MNVSGAMLMMVVLSHAPSSLQDGTPEPLTRALEHRPQHASHHVQPASARQGERAARPQADEEDGDEEEPPNPADFIALGDEPKTVHITVIAAYDMKNGGMNFNGYAHGGATFRVPEGWTVKLTFKNRSAVPHSAMVVESEQTDRLQLRGPYFEGASTKNPKRGGTKTETFTFVPDEQGDYAIACGFPGHSVGGHWLYFITDKPDTRPSLKLGDADPYVPTKDDPAEQARF